MTEERNTNIRLYTRVREVVPSPFHARVGVKSRKIYAMDAVAAAFVDTSTGCLNGRADASIWRSSGSLYKQVI